MGELGLLKWRPGGGNIWFLPGTPMDGRVANEFQRLCRKIYEQFGHDYTVMKVCSARFARGLHVITFNREEIISLFPRSDFKNRIIPTFFGGFQHKTDTTFGNIKADVCAFMIPNFHRKNFCDCILHSPWSE